MPTAKARRGLSIHIGLDYVDPNHYDGWDGKLAACVFDARDMIKLARSRKFRPVMLLNEQATSGNVTGAISDAAAKLDTGDMLWVSYSGHGGQVPDTNGDEKDGFDETWVLYDRQLVDDELYALWSRFAPGVRILVTSDSCHSGSVVRKIIYDQLKSSPIASAAPAADPLAGTRAMPEDAQKRTYRKNKATYDGIQKTFRSGEKIAVNASILLMSGCQDNQLSSDGKRNGLFTQTMLKVWGNGKFKGRYSAFHRAILDQMPPWQSPNFMRVGQRDPNFEAQTPFTI